MTTCFFQSGVQKNTNCHKGCDWLTTRKYYGDTITKKLRLIIIGFDTPPMMAATMTTTSSPSPTSPVTPATQANARAQARAIAIAVRLGRLQWSRCCPCRWRWCQACPPPPRPRCPRPRPPRRRSPLPSFSGRLSPPKRTCLGPPRRPSPLRAHQQRKSRVLQRPSPPLLRSGLPPSQSLSSWKPWCAGDTTTLASLCRQVE
jgi:hypothetical protein